MDALKELQDLGFRRNDALIYVELLKAGSTTPAALAQRLGFSRSYAYDALARLETQGIAAPSKERGQRVYAALAPEALAELAAQRADAFSSLVPALSALAMPRDGLAVEVHKGKYVYRTLLLDILARLRRGDEVLIFGIDDAQLLSDDWAQKRLRLYFAKAKRLAIRERAIVREGNVAPPEAITRYRAMREELFDAVAFEVYADTLALFLRGEPDHLLLVRSARVAQSYRRQFELLWRQATPLRAGEAKKARKV